MTGIPGKTGVVYTLDRETGEFLWATPTVAQNVISHIDGATGVVTENPEVVFGAGKKPEHLVGIVEGLADADSAVLVTRLEPEGEAVLRQRFPQAHFDAEANAMVLGQAAPPQGSIAVLCAGTSDIPVAAEAALTQLAFSPRRIAELQGVPVKTVDTRLSRGLARLREQGAVDR